MPLPTKFDFIVAYSNTAAHSAINNRYIERSPFSTKGAQSNCNAAYAYLLRYGKRIGLRGCFATVDDICGTGEFSSYWIFNHRWQRVVHRAKTNVIFDKFSSASKVHAKVSELLIGTKKRIALYHNHDVRTLFDNKITTHKALHPYMVPTVAINIDSVKKIRTAKKILKGQIFRHQHANDFAGDLVLKNIFGGAGEHIYKIHTDARFKKIAAHSSDIHFLLQPFIHASNFGTMQKNGRADLRVIIGNKIILQSYIRVAKKGDFRANVSQGGSIHYIPLHKIPKQVLRMITKIQKSAHLKNALYTLDFMRSKQGNLYLVEGNASPGLTWSGVEDERRAKQLMRIIVKQLALMV